MSVHSPVRPSWTCAGCGLEWPCATRRRQLEAEYLGSPATLTVQMSGVFAAAAADLPAVPAGVLRRRFLGWTRPL